jgi:hypothetical protein
VPRACNGTCAGCKGIRSVDDAVGKCGAVVLGAMTQPTRLVAIACTMSDDSLSAWLSEVTTSDSNESARKWYPVLPTDVCKQSFVPNPFSSSSVLQHGLGEDARMMSSAT